MDKIGPQEMEQGPPKEELDFLEDTVNALKSGATFGQATTKDYPSIFYAENPELEGGVEVHQAVEQQTLKRYPGIVSKAEMHSIENLCGIPKEISSDLHQSQIRREWNQFTGRILMRASSSYSKKLLKLMPSTALSSNHQEGGIDEVLLH
jgi:hypothetical protein